jgi:hypothetical protein
MDLLFHRFAIQAGIMAHVHACLSSLDFIVFTSFRYPFSWVQTTPFLLPSSVFLHRTGLGKCADLSTYLTRTTMPAVSEHPPKKMHAASLQITSTAVQSSILVFLYKSLLSRSAS